MGIFLSLDDLPSTFPFFVDLYLHGDSALKKTKIYCYTV